MTVDEAILTLRKDPQFATLVRDAYLGPDVMECAERFLASGEFQELKKLVSGSLKGGKVLDLGAGNGIASYAFAKSGAGQVWAVEPDSSGEVGAGAISKISQRLPIQIVKAFGEKLPLENECADLVYARQVLHHSSDLFQVLRECARVLKQGGVFFACREHVADTEDERQRFLQTHPMHQLAGVENAFPLKEYVSAIRASGLKMRKVYGPWDSVINTFPDLPTEEERLRYPRTRLEKKFGRLGNWLSYFPGARWLMWKRISRPLVPGRLYSFMAVKV